MYSNKTAIIGFDDYGTLISPRANARLVPRGRLPPILCAFCNSDLVDQPINYHSGASACIDDYFRWCACRTAEENLTKIHTEDIPRIEQWVWKPGSRFSPEKTKLIHATRSKGEHSKGKIIKNGQAIQPSTAAKLPGVFDVAEDFIVELLLSKSLAENIGLGMGGNPCVEMCNIHIFVLCPLEPSKIRKTKAI